MSHRGERVASGRSRSRRAASSQTAGQEVWRPGSDDCVQDPLPDPTQTLSQEISGYLTPLPSEFSVFVSTGQDHWRRKWQSGSQQSPDDGRPSTPFKRLDKRSHRGPTASTSGCALRCRVKFLSGRQRLGRSARGAMEEASSVNKSSTEKPTKCQKRKVFGSFFRRLWKAMKSPFGCCFHSSAVDVVEPFVLPADLESEPDPEPSPAPDRSAVKTNNESFESLYNAGEMIGSGGFGRVFEETHRFDTKKVAFKRIRKTDNNRYLDIPGHPKPLVTEVALLLMMRREPISPYIIQLYEWFEHP
ncbi:uncharacterized protein LOC125269879 [Megalobrama amblycephala]|uniref:uncharacterized protein LOC125269879 n=1 Tax=Megalobrama amblycephala TaxID=75352 RepID=UPI0020143E2D|nr:uncharacterized protein LOC125269879 [Megalobrama amblycephala]XP_048048878.1 uncharacterized protein LOC125269879 [Megalobrama amblycephala]XP_048048879.1 uncharacterized protein LOC125269879 [Megalobrama amblycephala]XP_048048880.1 uncharacterized protein LOC125269879 [Megalobrama amblycephala]